MAFESTWLRGGFLGKNARRMRVPPKIRLVFLFFIALQHAVAAPNYYEFLGVPSNLSQELINETISARMQNADPQMRLWLAEVRTVIGDPHSRAQYDRSQFNVPANERVEQLAESLEKTYSLSSRPNSKAALLLMLRSESETGKMEPIPGQERFAIEERAVRASLESEKHYVVRHLFVDRLPDFIAGNPTFEEIEEVGRLLRGGAQLALRGGEQFDEWAQPYNQLLNVVRDSPLFTQEQFETCFHQWVDNSQYEPDYFEIRHPEAKIWFDRFEKRFHRPAIQLAQSDLQRINEFDDINSRFLFYSEGVPATALFSLFKKVVFQFAKRYGTNRFYEDHFFEESHRRVLARLFGADPELRSQAINEGSMFFRIASVFSTRAACRYILSQYSKLPNPSE